MSASDNPASLSDGVFTFKEYPGLPFLAISQTTQQSFGGSMEVEVTFRAVGSYQAPFQPMGARVKEAIKDLALAFGQVGKDDPFNETDEEPEPKPEKKRKKRKFDR